MRLTAIFALVVVAACGSEPTATAEFETPPATPTPSPTPTGMATANVRLRITGDESLIDVGDALYDVQIDNGILHRTSPYEHLAVQLTPGSHEVRLIRTVAFMWFGVIEIDSGFEPWCDPVPPYSVEQSFASGTSTDVEFVIDCPSSNGSGTVKMTLSASGRDAPDSVRVDFISMIVGPPSFMIMAPTNRELEIALNAGAYMIGVDTPKCPFNSGPYSALAWPFVLHVGAIRSFAIALPCL